MKWKDLKTWQKGLTVGLIPFVLTIILTLILLIFVKLSFTLLLGILIFLFFFSFVFFIFAFLIGLVIHKSLKTKILVLLVVVILIILIINYAYSGTPPPGEVETYKGVWISAFPMVAKTLLFDVEQLKADGVNTLSFGPNYHTDEEGNIHEIPFMKELTILYIQAAHRSGFKVFLVTDMWTPGFKGVKNETLFFEQATDISLEWAEIAEEYGVEMYAPSNEPSIIVEDKEAVNQWAHDVAIQIKEKYHGTLVYKTAIAEWGFDNDYRGYDYIGLDLFPYNQTLDEFREHVRFQIEKGLEFAERDGAKGVILSEIGVQVAYMEDVSSTTETPFSLDYQEQAYEMFFEEGDDKVFGYFFCCWDEEFGPNNMPAEEVMKEWFYKLE